MQNYGLHKVYEMMKMEDDNSESNYSYGSYSYKDKKPTEGEHGPDKPERSKPQKIYSHLKKAKREGKLGLVKSELAELTGLSPGIVETLLYKLASRGEVTFRDFPDPELVDVEKPAVRVWYVGEEGKG